MAQCRSCGAPIRWVVIEKSGKRMPVDSEPSITGNIAVSGERASYVTPDANATPMRHLSHFATCPNATSHRKR